MKNFADLTGFYTLLWIILLPAALVLRIGKRSPDEKAGKCSLMGGMSAYFSSGH